MTRRPRRIHSPAFKTEVALAAIRGEQTLVDCPSSLMSTPIISNIGKTGSLRHQAISVMKPRRNRPVQPSMCRDSLKIGELTLVNDFLFGALGNADSWAERMIDREHKPSVPQKR